LLIAVFFLNLQCCRQTFVCVTCFMCDSIHVVNVSDACEFCSLQYSRFWCWRSDA